MRNTGVRHKKETISAARSLRKNDEMSIKQIAVHLGVSPSTVLKWCSGINISKKAKNRLLESARKVSSENTRRLADERREEWIAEAGEFFELHGREPEFVFGIGLYWGEGTKRNSRNTRGGVAPLALSNSDHKLARAWLGWCKKYFPMVSQRIRLTIHDRGLSESAVEFWKRELNWSGDIYVTVAISSASKLKRPKNSLPNGTINIASRKGATELGVKMKEWIRLASIVYW